MTATFPQPPLVQLRPPRRTVELKIDGATVQAPEGSTILDACRAQERKSRRSATSRRCTR
jgi:hypothetical protein